MFNVFVFGFVYLDGYCKIMYNLIYFKYMVSRTRLWLVENLKVGALSGVESFFINDHLGYGTHGFTEIK